MNLVGLNILGKAAAVVVFAAFILLVDYVGLFNGTNNYFYDLSFRLRGSGDQAKNVVIIAVDDKTLGKLGRWPIRRLHYASLLAWLKEADTVAFDIMMAEPSADDSVLEESVKRHGKVVFPVIIDDRMVVTYPVVGSAPGRMRPGSGRLGHVHLEQGIDGVVREVYHTLLCDGDILPSFSSVAFENATGKVFRRTLSGSPRAQKGAIIQNDRMNINYCGGPGTFEMISLSDVLAGVYPSSFFRRRICLVGVTATGAGETLLTPFTQERRNTAGVEIQANVLSTLLLGNAIHVVTYWAIWVSTILLVVLSFVCFLRMSERRAAVLASSMLLCLAAVAYTLFSVFNVWLAPSMFFFAVPSAFFISYAFKFNEAIDRLDGAYMAVASHLRWHEDRGSRRHQGFRGLLTPGGVYSKAQVLGDVTDQLLFEKQLTDAAILSDVQGVLLFGPDGASLLKNNLSAMLCEKNGVRTGSVDTFIKDLASFVLDKIDVGDVPDRLYAGEHHVTFNVSLPSPGKKYFKVDASPLGIRGGRYPLFVLSDITTVKELELLKSHVVSLVSHEIKTPLLSIEGFSDMLSESLEGEMKGYAVVVQRESARLIRFLNTFLDITRIEGGQQPIRMAPVMLSDAVNEVVHELGALAGEHGITIRAEVPGEVGPVVLDRDLIKQCLINLAENAIKYSPPGKDVVVRLVEEADRVRIEVIDHGIGIREEEMKMVFEKFYRVRSEDTRNITGSGLGLTFVREAVGVQGGEVAVESQYGEGSTFSVLFPKTRGRESE
jgi:CHASE2 domain-containing sensor protein